MLWRWLSTSTVLLLLASSATAQFYYVSARVAQSSDAVTGASGTLVNNFTGFAAVDATGQTAFVGETIGGIKSVMVGIGGGVPNVLATYGTPIPGTASDTFQSFGATPTIGTGGIAFYGDNAASSPTSSGIYLASGGSISVVADRTTPVPGGSLGNFTGFSSGQAPGVNGNTVSFRATYGTSGNGLYVRYNGSIITNADTSSTSIPDGAGLFTTIGANQSVSGSNVVFRGSGSASQQGIYFRDVSSVNNSLLRVTDKTQTLPGTTALITSLSEPTISGNTISLYASASTVPNSVRVVQYAWNGSNTTPVFTPSVLVSYGDAVPGLIGATFTNFTSFVSSDSGKLAFLGTFNNGVSRTGIFVHDGTTLYRVMDTTQTLDDKTINSFLFGPDAISGDKVTFYATFSDSTRGVYTATLTPVPEPVGLLALGGLIVFIRRMF